MGSKTRAREMMKEAGVPIVPGTTEPVDGLKEAQADREGDRLPGRRQGSRRRRRQGLPRRDVGGRAREGARGRGREGEKFFSDPTVYLERYLEDPRHVEVQVLADAHGNVVHLGERDCSVQRRHQKLIEETPAPGVDEEFRERIGKIATDAARAIGYRSAGTIEGLLARDEDGEPEYFFLEMNTRVQVEHTVTEMATGIDIVREQIRIAAGEPLSFAQEDVEIRGALDRVPDQRRGRAQEVRPRAGAHHHLREPAGPGVRVDSGVEAGSEITPDVRPDGRQADRLGLRPRGRDRAHAARAGRVRDRRPDHADPVPQGAAAHEAVARAETCRDLVEDPKWLKSLAPEEPRRAGRGGRGGGRGEGRARLHGRGRQPPLLREGDRPAARRAAGWPRRELGRARAARRGASAAAAPPTAPARALVSPLQGTVLKVNVKKGEEVEAGAVICVIEAMKMENEITAPVAGKVEELNVSEGASVAAGDTIAVIK